MKNQSAILLAMILIVMATAPIYAQTELRMKQPDLQTTEFFDPTKKVREEPYQFSTNWRIEGGYVQWQERTKDTTALYQHGLRLGATIDFNLPYHFSIQTGALATLTYGVNQQHWRSVTAESSQVEIMKHHIVQLQLTIPVRAYYNIKLWKQLHMFFFAGPQLHIGLTNYDLIQNLTSPQVTAWLEQVGKPTTNYERYLAKEIYRTNIQFGLGGGFEWDRYRLQAGYDFGLNNLQRNTAVPTHKLYEWGWMVAFGYRL